MTRPTPPPAGAPRPDQPITPARFQPPAGGMDLSPPRLPWREAAVALVLAVAVWAVWFVLTARSVGIRVTPADAAVTVREFPSVQVGDHWLLRPGARRVLAAAPGYVSFDGTIEVGPEQLQTRDIVLERLPGHLRVALAPVERAELRVDGRPLGEVPGVVRDVPAGSHEVEVRAPRYQPYVVLLDIEGKGIEQTLDVTLEPDWAMVTVDSRPGGAEVRADRELVGHTPLEFELLSGRRVIELVKDGYKPWQQALNVSAGTPVKLGQIVLAKADGRLTFDSLPSGANVTVDGEYRGRTPLTLAVSPDKRHTLRVIKQGYQPLEQAVELAAGKTDTLTVELVAELARLQIETTPATAELLVDGELRGSATQTIELPTFEHELTVRAPGHATYQTRITPRKGVVKRVRIRLKTAAEAAAEGAGTVATPAATAPGGRRTPAASGPAAGTLTTHAGQRMKLFTGGDAVLGSSRREPGHRANEVQRPVSLKRPFYLALNEVTNAEFRQFLAAHSSGEFAGQGLDDDRQPVTGVSWETAALYCNWLSRRDGLPPFYQIKYGEVLGVNPDATGYRLPTEAEWEWAARIPPGGTPTAFPWGEKFPPRGRSGNYADSAARGVVEGALADYDDGFAVAAPVGSFAPNLRGLYDLDGNVAEWVHDVYDAAPASTPTVDPLGPPRGVEHVVKGASWTVSAMPALRLAWREGAGAARHDLGFRLARYAQ
ncbi:MAG: PEGA domain-containing protein [Gammaproteobacteria bacterium]